MFTGIIEEIGTLRSLSPMGIGLKITIGCSKIIDDLKVDDSVSLNGMCQTVISKTNDSFTVEAVDESVRKTTLKFWKTGDKINLERALTLNTRLGGHIVQGHVDCTAKVYSIQKETAGILLWVNYPEEFRKYIVSIGSVALNGVSLTIAKIESNRLMTSIIPHTWKNTTLRDLQPGSELNIEFDILGKYIENLLTNKHLSPNSSLDKYITQPD